MNDKDTEDIKIGKEHQLIDSEYYNINTGDQN